MGLKDKIIDGVISQLYKRYDKDEDGGLDARELKSMLEFVVEKTGMEVEINESLVEQAMKAIDKDQDSEVSKDELREIIKWVK